MAEVLDKALRDLKDPIIVTGAAKGADALAEEWAYFRRHTVMRFHADWTGNGKAAGPIRNQEMLDFALERRPAFLVAFWDGKSPGTKDMIDRASKAGLRMKVIKYRDIYHERFKNQGAERAEPLREVPAEKPRRGRGPVRGR